VVEKQVLTIVGSDAATLEAGVAAAQDATNAIEQQPAIAGAKNQVPADAQGTLYVMPARVLAVMDLVTGGSGNEREGGRGGRGRGRGRGGRGGGDGPPTAMTISVRTAGTTAEVQVFVPVSAMLSVMRLAGIGGG
jgi:hypothetical protein